MFIPPQQPNYKVAAANAARKYGVDPNIFLRQIGQESGFNPHAHSSAGAIGIAQFMPGTAAGYHLNPNDPMASLDAAARMDAGNLKKYGSYEQMLSAYNSGNANAYKDPNFAGGQTYNYVRSIMGGSNPGMGQPQPAQMQPNPSMGPKLDLMKYLMASNQAIANHTPQQSILSFMQNSPQNVTGGSVPSSQAQSGVEGKVMFAPGADRKGVPTSSAVRAFVGQIAGMVGRPLTIGTGSNHSKMTADGNVSDHWNGNAADIPATGAKLIQLGRAALIAAGMPPAQANKQTGGLYNVGGHQIIFNTHQGGDHTNHLHVSAKGK